MDIERQVRTPGYTLRLAPLLALWLAACGDRGTVRPSDATDTTTTTSDATPTGSPTPTTDPSTPTTPTTPTTDTGTPTNPLGALVFTDGVPPANLLIISLDTTRRDHVGRFSGNGLTPNLDDVLAQSVVLEDHRSCSNWTAWSMTCVVSGRNPMQNGFATWNSDPNVPALPGPGYSDGTLAGLLGAAGHRTLLVTANSVFSNWATGVSGQFQDGVNLDYAQAETVTATALPLIEDLRTSGSDWYAHVHFMDPHGPYCAPDMFLNLGMVQPAGITTAEWCADSYGPGGSFYALGPAEQQILVDAHFALYEGEMAYWDTEFGAFWDALEASGALDDTLVVFVTDHGQQFFERGGHGHGIFLGDEENRSTAAFWARDLVPTAWTGPTYHPDVAATLHAVFGLTPPLPVEGVVVGNAPADRAIRLENYWGWEVDLGIVKNGKQLVYRWYGGRWFFDHAVDPAGLTDTYDATNPDVIDLWGDMSLWIDEVLVAWPHLPPPVDPGP